MHGSSRDLSNHALSERPPSHGTTTAHGDATETSETAQVHLRRAFRATKRGDHTRALDHARRAKHAGVFTADQHYRLGRLLFKLNAVSDAERVLKSGIGIDTSPTRVAEALRILSAIAQREKRPSDARTFIQYAAKLCPFEFPKQMDAMKPTLLRIREVDNSQYKIKKSKRTGQNIKQLKGGHFSPKNLIGTDFNVIVLNVTAQTLPDVSALPPIDLIINSVTCPDLCGSSLHHIRRILDLFPGVPVINAPDAVLQTTRNINAARIGALDGIRFPKTYRISTMGSVVETVAEIEALDADYPLIVRRSGTQTGRSVARIDNRSDLTVYIEQLENASDVYVIQYIDCRGSDGFFHKTRCFFIDGDFYPVAHLTSDKWMIHSGDRFRVMRHSRAAQRAEKQYLHRPKDVLGSRVLDRLYRIADVIQLDFFGIDFTVLPNGELLVFEANAAMRHNFDHATRFPYTRPFLESITHAFQTMMVRKAGLRSKSG